MGLAFALLTYSDIIHNFNLNMAKSALSLVIFVSFLVIETLGQDKEFDWSKMKGKGPSFEQLEEGMKTMEMCYMKYEDKDGVEQEYSRDCPPTHSCNADTNNCEPGDGCTEDLHSNIKNFHERFAAIRKKMIGA